jgi:hypothetical protein
MAAYRHPKETEGRGRGVDKSQARPKHGADRGREWLQLHKEK